MKKILISFVLFIFSLSYFSCGKQLHETTATLEEETAVLEEETSETNITEISSTDIVIETTSTTSTTSAGHTTDTTSAEQETTVESSSAVINLPEFESFGEFPGDLGYFYGKTDISKNNYGDHVALRLRIIGVQNPNQDDILSVYYAEAITAYGMELTKPNEVYCLGYRGTYQNSLYGRPPLEVGEEYMLFIESDFESISPSPYYENKPIIQMHLMMPLVESNGTTYVYGYGIDFSKLDCAIEITDFAENQIYKEGKHDDILAYLNSIEKEAPTFDYKCELYALLQEVGILK